MSSDDDGRGAVRSDEGLLADQLVYYRRRAPEYDEWWRRVGRYDQGEDEQRRWEEEVGVLERELAEFHPGGDVLELAGGTGWWTERLARTAATLTVLDGSPETLEINRRRVGDRAGLTYLVADLFSWEPTTRFDAVFFSFWLSHVPSARFGQFWDLVARCLRPDGRVFLIDNRREPFWGPDLERGVLSHREEVQLRTLRDGSEHRLVKIFYEPDELGHLIGGHGWETDMGGTRLFIYGSARRRAGGEEEG
jgi:ubiquinone/menaquinone biosynthesis C-methylase UbiE